MRASSLELSKAELSLTTINLDYYELPTEPRENFLRTMYSLAIAYQEISSSRTDFNQSNRKYFSQLAETGKRNLAWVCWWVFSTHMFQYVEVTKPSEYGPENSELLSLPALHFPPSVVLDDLGFGKNRSYHSVESLVQNAKYAFKGFTNGIGPCEGFDNDFFEPYKVGDSRVT